MTRKEILEAAEKCVCGQREEDYGTPEDSFGLIAELWTPVIRTCCVPPETDVRVLPETVALMMVLLKVARLMGNLEHMDSWVDLAGYAACGGEVAMKYQDDENKTWASDVYEEHRKALRKFNAIRREKWGN